MEFPGQSPIREKVNDAQFRKRLLIGASLAVILTLALCSIAAEQGKSAPPGRIVLLPGYKHERLEGTDSQPGRIWKEQGLTIHYDIGGLAPNRITSSNLLWSKKQTIHGMQVEMGLTANRRLEVVFTSTPARRGVGWSLPAAFWATVRSDEDIGDMLFMVMGCTPD